MAANPCSLCAKGFRVDLPARHPASKRRRIDVQRNRPNPGVPASTGPKPFLRRTNQAAADGIVVDVIDHLPGGVRVCDITIVTTTGLPEASLDDAVRPRHGQMAKPVRSIALQEAKRFASYRPFDAPKNHLNTVLGAI